MFVHGLVVNEDNVLHQLAHLCKKGMTVETASWFLCIFVHIKLSL